MISEAISAIASIKKIDRDAVAETTSANARKLFGLERIQSPDQKGDR
jgi:Tat protein secretion system quality control protein TatD with DNase activity